MFFTGSTSGRREKHDQEDKLIAWHEYVFGTNQEADMHVKEGGLWPQPHPGPCPGSPEHPHGLRSKTRSASMTGYRHDQGLHICKNSVLSDETWILNSQKDRPWKWREVNDDKASTTIRFVTFW